MSELPTSSPAPTPLPTPETRQNPTNPDTSPRPNRPLSHRQLAAIPLLLAGQPDADVAAAIGVTRQTVCDWRNHHPAFIARLNLERHHRHAATADRYDRLLNQAMDTVERINSYNNGWTDEQLRIATFLLRSASLRSRALSAPTNPADILQSLVAQGLSPAPDDADPDSTPTAGGSTGVAQGGHEGGTGGARGVHGGSTGGARG